MITKMDLMKDINLEYMKTLSERVKKSRVHKPYQSTGLLLAEILEDQDHKALYMKMSRIYDGNELIRIAKDLAERKNVENKGAYFMTLIKKLKEKEIK